MDAKETYLRSRNNLSTTSLTLRSTLNDTRQIQNLDLGTAILQYARDGSQGGERVRCRLTLGLSDLGQECRLSY